MIDLTNDRFFRASGARAPLRITVESEGPQPPGPFEFLQPFILVGSHAAADLRLDGDDISRKQLYIQVLQGHLFATHLSARVPTMWDATSQPFGWINADMALRFGPYKLRFQIAANPGDARQPCVNPLAGGSYYGPPVALVLKDGRNGANRAVVDRVLTLVGNEPICKLRMNSSRVSGVHCSLVRTVEGLWVVDLAGREGVLVNGNVVRSALLIEGDLLQIGNRRLEVRYEQLTAPTDVSPPPETTDGTSFSPTEIQLANPNGSAVGTRPTATSDGNAAIEALGPIIDRMSAFQAQTFEQFQEIINAMMRSFGGVFMEHREFVRQELERMEQMSRTLAEHRPPAAASSPPSAPPAQPAPDLSVPLPPLSASAPSGDDVHIWLQQRIDELSERRSSLWEKMASVLRSKTSPPPGH